VGEAGGGGAEMGEGRELGLQVGGGMWCPLYIMLAIGLEGPAGSGSRPKRLRREPYK
jgi:hypothetical protein